MQKGLFSKSYISKPSLQTRAFLQKQLTPQRTTGTLQTREVKSKTSLGQKSSKRSCLKFQAWPMKRKPERPMQGIFTSSNQHEAPFLLSVNVGDQISKFLCRLEECMFCEDQGRELWTNLGKVFGLDTGGLNTRSTRLVSSCATRQKFIKPTTGGLLLQQKMNEQVSWVQLLVTF